MGKNIGRERLVSGKKGFEDKGPDCVVGSPAGNCPNEEKLQQKILEPEQKTKSRVKQIKG